MTADHKERTIRCEKTFGATVLKVRGILLITQGELAAALKMSPVTINRWENGKVDASFLSRNLFFKYCEEQGLHLE